MRCELTSDRAVLTPASPPYLRTRVRASHRGRACRGAEPRAGPLLLLLTHPGCTRGLPGEADARAGGAQDARVGLRGSPALDSPRQQRAHRWQRVRPSPGGRGGGGKPVAECRPKGAVVLSSARWWRSPLLMRRAGPVPGCRPRPAQADSRDSSPRRHRLGRGGCGRKHGVRLHHCQRRFDSGAPARIDRESRVFARAWCTRRWAGGGGGGVRASQRAQKYSTNAKIIQATGTLSQCAAPPIAAPRPGLRRECVCGPPPGDTSRRREGVWRAWYAHRAGFKAMPQLQRVCAVECIKKQSTQRVDLTPSVRLLVYILHSSHLHMRLYYSHSMEPTWQMIHEI